MTNWKRGDFVQMKGLLAVVVGVSGDPDVPEDHVALWFGEPQGKRDSEGRTEAHRPEVYTVPADYCTPAPEPFYLH